jgi:type IV secretory pathway VirB4 component
MKTKRIRGLKYESGTGDHISKLAIKLANMAAKEGKRVTSVFNGVTLVVRPGDRPERIIERYRRSRKRILDEFHSYRYVEKKKKAVVGKGMDMPKTEVPSLKEYLERHPLKEFLEHYDSITKELQNSRDENARLKEKVRKMEKEISERERAKQLFSNELYALARRIANS